MSLLAALAKGLGAGTLQNAKAGFDEQTRQKEENRRQAEIRAQIAAGKDDLNTRLKFEAEQERIRQEHELAMFKKKLAVATEDAALQGSRTARKENAEHLIRSVEFIQKQKQQIMDSDTITPEQKIEQMAKMDMLGVMVTQDPYSQTLLKEHGGGGYVDYYASMMPSQNQPQQGGEPTSGTNQQPTSAPSRPGGSGGSGGGVKLAGDWQPSVPDGYQSAIPQPKAFTGGGAPQPQGYQQPGGRTFFGDDLPDAYHATTGIIGRMREQQSSGPNPQQAAGMAWGYRK